LTAEDNRLIKSQLQRRQNGRMLRQKEEAYTEEEESVEAVSSLVDSTEMHYTHTCVAGG